MLLPLVVLIYLLVSSYSPGKSVVWSIVLLVACATLRKSTRMGPKKLLLAIVDGVYGALSRSELLCACAGIVSGVISLTGLGLRFSSILIQLLGRIAASDAGVDDAGFHHPWGWACRRPPAYIITCRS